jgi:hypothetical protein
MNTTIKASNTNVNMTSQKLIDYLVKLSAEENLSNEEMYRRLIENTLEHAKNSTTKHPSIEVIASNYAATDAVLLRRLYETREVASNTLAKMTRGIPNELIWACGYRRTLTIIGLYRKVISRYDKENENITSKVENGTTKLLETDMVRFSIAGWSSDKSQIAELPLSLLKGDPMAVSQMVRKACKEYAEKNEEEDQRADTDRKKILEAQIATATTELLDLEASKQLQLDKVAKETEVKARNAAYHASITV